MALLYDQDTELKAIISIVDDRVPEKYRTSLLGRLTSEHFHNAPTLAAFNRVSSIAKKRYEILTRDELVADPVIDEDLRDILRTNFKKVKPCKNQKQIRSVINVLDKYRKIRSVYGIANDSFKELDKTEVDIDSLLSEITEAVAKANSGLNDDQFFLNFGKNDTSDKIIERLLTNEKPTRIPTGYAEYDSRNGGVPEKGVMIIAATTSGGKSTVAMNLGAQFYLKQNKSVCRISLEMDDMAETRRLASHLTRIPFSKFQSGKLSSMDKQTLKRKMKEFSEHGVKHGIVYTSISPDKGVTSEEAFAMVAPFGYNIIMIDYIGLLAGMDAKSQWFQLSEVAAAAKRFSSAHNCLVVVLAQLDDTTEGLRYSKGIKEHADTMWKWSYVKPEQRELHILPIRCDKDRDGEVFSFELAERFDVMTAENLQDTGYSPESGSSYSEEEDEEDEKPTKKKKRKKGKRKDYDEDQEEPTSYALT